MFGVQPARDKSQTQSDTFGHTIFLPARTLCTFHFFYTFRKSSESWERARPRVLPWAPPPVAFWPIRATRPHDRMRSFTPSIFSQPFGWSKRFNGDDVQSHAMRTIFL